MRVHIYFCLSLQKILAGVDDLQQVKALEMRVDTREISLGNFGKKYFIFCSSSWIFLNVVLTGDSLTNSQWKVLSFSRVLETGFPRTLFDLCLRCEALNRKLWQWDEWHDFCLKPISLDKFFLYDMLGPKRAFTLVFSETGVKCQLLSTVRFPCDWGIASAIRWLMLPAACLCTQPHWAVLEDELEAGPADTSFWWAPSSPNTCHFFYVIITEPGRWEVPKEFPLQQS